MDVFEGRIHDNVPMLIIPAEKHGESIQILVFFVFKTWRVHINHRKGMQQPDRNVYPISARIDSRQQWRVAVTPQYPSTLSAADVH